MRVRELAAKLAQMDPELEVYAYTEDERFATDKRLFFMLDIVSVTIAQGVMSRDEDRLPIVTFDNEAPGSRKFVTLDVTSDF